MKSAKQPTVTIERDHVTLLAESIMLHLAVSNNNEIVKFFAQLDQESHNRFLAYHLKMDLNLFTLARIMHIKDPYHEIEVATRKAALSCYGAYCLLQQMGDTELIKEFDVAAIKEYLTPKEVADIESTFKKNQEA